MKTYDDILAEIIESDENGKNDVIKFTNKLIESTKQFIKDDNDKNERPFSKAIDFNITTEFNISKLQFRYILYLLDKSGWRHTETFKDNIMTLRIYI